MIKNEKGMQTRDRILEEAVHFASVHGLEALTIGELAGITGLSKSGLFRHFGSKQDLQMEVVHRAAEIFHSTVIAPVEGLPFGLERLLRLIDGWLGHLENHTFRGGCFFATVTNEFDGRPGPVNQALRGIMRGWLKRLEKEIRAAISCGEISSGLDPVQAVFELQAVIMGANWFIELFQDREAASRAWRAVHGILGLGDPGPRISVSINEDISSEIIMASENNGGKARGN